MPVTARLSRRFYEQLGDELATELVDWFNAVDATYRSDLDRLNELNFARFDAKLEQRFAEQDAKWERRFSQLDAKWEQRFAQQDAKMEQRMAHLEILLEKGLAHLRTDLIRWMFAFWTGSVLTFGGLLFAVLRSHASP
jgi:enoyl reductase-like protein